MLLLLLLAPPLFVLLLLNRTGFSDRSRLTKSCLQSARLLVSFLPVSQHFLYIPSPSSYYYSSSSFPHFRCLIRFLTSVNSCQLNLDELARSKHHPIHKDHIFLPKNIFKINFISIFKHQDQQNYSK